MATIAEIAILPQDHVYTTPQLQILSQHVRSQWQQEAPQGKKLYISYKFKKIGQAMESIPEQWNEAEKLPLAPEPEQPNDNKTMTLLIDRETSVKFPLDGWVYKEFKYTTQHTLPTDKRARAEGTEEHPQRDQDNREAQEESTRLNPNDFESLLPYLNEKHAVLLTETRLRQHFRITEQGNKATALQLFMEWATELQQYDPSTALYSAYVKLGKRLHSNLRLTAAAVDLRVPQAVLQQTLQTETEEDPESIAITRVRERATSRGRQIFRGGNRGRGTPIWAAPPQPASVTRPRTCRYCGEQHTGPWHNHRCTQHTTTTGSSQTQPGTHK